MIDTVRQHASSTSEFAAPLAAGTYLVGDPCYAFDNNGPDYWVEWLNSAWKDVDPNRVNILDGRVQGVRVAASRTAYGDGFYNDQDSYGYGVDAGLLGAVHIDHLGFLYPSLKGLPTEELEEKTGMRVVEFPAPFHVSFNEETGTVSVGHIDIETGDDSDDEY